MPMVRMPRDAADTGDAETSPASDNWPQLPLSESEFNFIRDLAYAYTGIKIADYKRNMVFRRITKRLRALDMEEVSDYCRFVSGEDGHSELQHLINVLTTNKTAFFREKHHFDHLATQALPGLMANRLARETRRLRVWSAGCSSGEEPYSIAITLLAATADLVDWDVKILATDIDTEMIEQAQHGVYATEDVKAIPPKARYQYVERMGRDKTQVRMTRDVKSLIDYRPLNLLGPWPMQGSFDVIFCRNVVIYFDKPTKRVLFDRFADVLAEDGLLYIGHAESLFKLTQRFRIVGQSVYRKIS